MLQLSDTRQGRGSRQMTKGPCAKQPCCMEPLFLQCAAYIDARALQADKGTALGLAAASLAIESVLALTSIIKEILQKSLRPQPISSAMGSYYYMQHTAGIGNILVGIDIVPAANAALFMRTSFTPQHHHNNLLLFFAEAVLVPWKIQHLAKAAFNNHSVRHLIDKLPSE